MDDFVGQKLHGAIELAAHFERLHQALLKTEIFKAAALREGNSERLLIVVAQDELRHLVGHLGKQCVARLHRELAGAHGAAQRNLDVDLDVGRVDACGIIDRIGVEPDAALGRLDAPALGHAEIGALADHLALDLAAGDANGVVGAIAGGFIALVRRADIRADAAEEQKIGRRLEDGLHQLLWRHGFGDTEELARFRAQLDLLRCARINASAFAKSGSCRSPASSIAAARTSACARQSFSSDRDPDR